MGNHPEASDVNLTPPRDPVPVCAAVEVVAAVRAWAEVERESALSVIRQLETRLRWWNSPRLEREISEELWRVQYADFLLNLMDKASRP